MRAAQRVLLALLALATWCPPDESLADPPVSQTRIVGLQVADGNGWHAENSFRLDWDFEAASGAPAVAAVHFRVRFADGAEAIPEQRLPAWEKAVDFLRLPRTGEYVAEVWAEDTQGLSTPRATTILRLDQERPAATQPLLPAGWIAGGEAAHLRLAHPEGPQPLSGIRGYAISIDGDPEGSPCVSRELCSDEETDLRTGIAGDSLTLPSLPEGSVFVHAVAVSGSGMRSERAGVAVAHVDATAPRVALHGAPSGWAAGPVRLLAAAADGLSGMNADGPGGPFTAIAVDGGPAMSASGASVAAVVSGDGAHRVEYYARDAAGNVNAGTGRGDPPASATVRIDTGPPRAAFVNRRDAADPDRIEASVTDALSGPSATRGAIAIRPARSRQPFEPLPTTAAAGQLTANWDSASYPAGTYEFQVTGYDAAGNSASSVNRANGSRMALFNPAKARTSLEAGFGGRRLSWHRCGRDEARRHCQREAATSYAGRPAVRTVPYGRGIAFSGRLATAEGAPLTGELVEVAEAFERGAASDRRTTLVRTGADGGFAVRLAPGPSRRVEAFFPGARALSRAAAPPLELNVRGHLRMRASASTARVGGRPVLFSGRLAHADATLPAGGIPVELQFRLPGLEWSEFRTVNTDRDGRFRYRYAFADDDSRGVRFQFRAVAASEDGWPYEPAVSPPVFVTGR
jgi:hypothetical protein